jgi:two-component system, chemotaxis family, CheB/CheR fusion protein
MEAARQHEAPDHEITVVGIGASAGGLAALKQFFSHVPDDSGLAYVVVVHLSPDRESHLADLLQPHVRMPVQQVTETLPLEKDHVYVIPPGCNLNTIDTHLRLSDLESRRRERAPIDHFLRTLATTHQGDAVAVILTGTGSDGTLGIKEIKGKGGLTVVQDPSEAEFDGMPQSAVASGMVDLVLPLARIPEQVLKYARTRPRIPVHTEDAGLEEAHRRHLQKIFALIRSRTGRDFTQYKQSTILRRIQRRMQMASEEELEGYVALLRENPDEIQALSDDFLVTVTSFFRDPEVFDHLAEEVFPALLRGSEEKDSVRIWSVGCATGEEAYSLAMLLVEVAGKMDVQPRLQVFASDLHEHSLKIAREGFYPGDIEAVVPPERLRRFFDHEKNGYRIRKELREIVIFAPHNLLSDPPFSKLDLISCRNVQIYLQREVQGHLMELFHYALNPDGYLVLGSAETIAGNDLFRLESKHHCLYRKRNVKGVEPRLPVFPIMRPTGRGGVGRPDDPEPVIAFGALHQRLVELYAPPSILVSPDNKVAHLSENAGRFLSAAGGEFTANIFRLVRQELRIELRTVLQKARESGRPVRSRPVAVSVNGHSSRFVISVSPATDGREEGYAIVVFEEVPAESAPPQSAATQSDPVAGELEAELDETKRQLQAIIEQHETYQEEMKAANEEMLSTNEELRSTLEELETSREELQSMNEELQTVNQENRHKVEELTQLSDDLRNLMAATDIATLFLDRDLRILRFTPRVEDLFSLRPADRGRPLSDFTNRLGYEELIDDARTVLRTLVPIEREVGDDNDRWYLARVLPYRSANERIEGVVLTFIEITDRKRSEEALRHSEERNRLLIEGARGYAIFMIDTEGRIASWNRAAKDLFGYDEEAAIGRPVAGLFAPESRAESFQEEMQAALEQGQAAGERWHRRNDGSRFWAGTVVTPLYRADGSSGGFTMLVRDDSERLAAEAARVHFQSLFESAPGLYVVVRPPDFEIVAASNAYLEATMTERDDIVGRPLLDMFPDNPAEPEADGASNLRASLQRVVTKRRADIMAVQRYPVRRPDSDRDFETRWWSVVNTPVFGPDGEFDYIIHRVEDVTAFILDMQQQDREEEGHRLLERRAETLEMDIALRAGELQRVNQQLVRLTETLEERVTERTEQMRRLASRLTMAEQEERRRISQILHDDLQQLLYGVQMKMAGIRQKLEDGNNQSIAEEFGQMRDWISRGIEKTRSLTVDLSPPILKSEGLVGALLWLQRQMEELHGLRVAIQAENDERFLDEDLRVLLFQIVRELLFNVKKHAGVDHATVELVFNEDQVSISVSDEGRGFEADALEEFAEQAESFGLISARERMRLIGGGMEVWAQPGNGTRVVLHAPIPAGVLKTGH